MSSAAKKTRAPPRQDALPSGNLNKQELPRPWLHQTIRIHLGVQPLCVGHERHCASDVGLRLELLHQLRHRNILETARL